MNGILVVDKPQGCTSHDVVDFIRKKFGFKKVGHAGTLDPMATGVLVVLIGKYTKSSGSFLNADKEYDATLVLGATSDTGDAWGNITPSKPISDPGSKIGVIEEVFRRFLGPIEQIPPAYSAVKFKGKKLYEFARRGIEIKLEPRKIVIKELKIYKIDGQEVSFSAACSKGTYIRQLCVDIGKELGCGAYLSRLRRTRSGDFTISEALSVEELKSFDSKKLHDNIFQ